jgi:hypothetical protein
MIGYRPEATPAPFALPMQSACSLEADRWARQKKLGAKRKIGHWEHPIFASFGFRRDR